MLLLLLTVVDADEQGLVLAAAPGGGAEGRVQVQRLARGQLRHLREAVSFQECS